MSRSRCPRRAAFDLTGHTVTLALADATEHWSFVRRWSARSVDETSADWIVEDPALNCLPIVSVRGLLPGQLHGRAGTFDDRGGPVMLGNFGLDSHEGSRAHRAGAPAARARRLTDRRPRDTTSSQRPNAPRPRSPAKGYARRRRPVNRLINPLRAQLGAPTRHERSKARSMYRAAASGRWGSRRIRPPGSGTVCGRCASTRRPLSALLQTDSRMTVQ